MTISNVFLEITKVGGQSERIDNITLNDGINTLGNQIVFNSAGFGTWTMGTNLSTFNSADVRLWLRDSAGMETGNGDSKDADITFGFTATDAAGNSAILSHSFAIDGVG